MGVEDDLDSVLEEFEHAEHEFEELKDPEASKTVREKQAEAEELISEIKSQIEFLKKQVD